MRRGIEGARERCLLYCYCKPSLNQGEPNGDLESREGRGVRHLSSDSTENKHLRRGRCGPRQHLAWKGN